MIHAVDSRIDHIRYRTDLFARPKEATREFVQSPPWLAEHIMQGIASKILPQPPASVLDLGCGNGYAAVLFAAHGYRAHGIDLQESLVERAQRASEELARQDVIVPARFAIGNYLPSDVRKRSAKAPHVLLEETVDPYSSLGKRPEEFDLFFVYPFPNQMESVFDLFMSSARPGAYLMALGDDVDWSANPPRELVHLGTQELQSADEDILCLRRSYTVYQKPTSVKQ
jgi:predicted O-methyltransferase YrrM